jgi:hypothetical protein
VENETSIQTSRGIAAWKVMVPAILVMMVVQGLNELSKVRASGYVTTISVSVISLSMMCMAFFSFRADREFRRFTKVILCGMGIAIAGILLGKLLGTPICYVAGYLNGFFHGLFNI